jgi:hypothetical protein
MSKNYHVFQCQIITFFLPPPITLLHLYSNLKKKKKKTTTKTRRSPYKLFKKFSKLRVNFTLKSLQLKFKAGRGHFTNSAE